MRLAYVTQYDATDILAWSGAGYYIAKALEAGGASLDLIGPLRQPSEFLLKCKQFAYLAFGKRHLRDREPGVVKSYAAQINERLASGGGKRAEIVFSPSTLPVGRLRCAQPIVIWIDATFATMVDYYPSFSNLSKATLRNGQVLEQAALDSSRLVIFASEWAARGAFQHYRLDPGKVHVVPFGGNVQISHGHPEIEAFVDARPTDECRLLFIGGEWHRKGGDIAVELARALSNAGLQTTLTLMGPEPHPDLELPPFVHVLGPITKETEEGRRRYEEVLRGAHFLIGPSRSDCSPLVFSEANAFGVPCLTSAVGGIPEIVWNGVNGFIETGEGRIERHRDIVLNLWANRHAYRSLAKSSFESFQTRLDWSVSGRKVCALLTKLLQRDAPKTPLPALPV